MNKRGKISLAAVATIIASLAAFGLSSNSGNTDNTPSTTPLPTQKFSAPTAVAYEQPSNAPNVAVDKNTGKMHVVYIAEAGAGHDIYLKSSSDGGKSFSDGVRINDVPGDVFLDGRVSPNISIGPNGQIYVLWVKADPAPELFMGVIRSLVFAYSEDGGITFSKSITIGEDELPSGKSFHSLDVSSDGKIYVGWLDSPATIDDEGNIMSDTSRPSTVRFVRSIDGGNSFEKSITVDANPCPCCNVHVLAESDDSVYVSWRKIFDNQDGPTIRDMVVAHSSDGGVSFSDPSKISDDNFEFDGCVHVGAPMALDASGRLHVVWYTGKPESPGLFYAVSSDGAKSFSEPAPILTGDWVPPLRVQLTADSEDTVWITWEDATGLSADQEIWRYDETKAMIYVAKVTPEGQITRTVEPLNQVEGKSPVISSGNGLVSIVWAGSDSTIQCSTLRT